MSMQEPKTLSNTTPIVHTSDMKTVGDTSTWIVICKAWSELEGWMKSTKGMVVGDDVLVQVTTQQRNPDGSYAVAEALSLLPDCYMVSDSYGGYKLQAHYKQP